MRILIVWALLAVAIIDCSYAQSKDFQKVQSIPALHQNSKDNKNISDSSTKIFSKNNKTISKNFEANQPNNNDFSNALIADYTGKLANYTAWLVFATIVLGIIGIVQGYFTYCQIKLNRREFIANHRPKLKIHHIFAEDFIIGKKTKGKILALNLGDTEAIIVNMVIDVFSHKLGEKERFKLTNPYYIKIDPIEAGVMADIDFESESVLQHVASNNIEYYAIGRLTYRDRNDVTRITGFVRIYDPIGKRFIRIPEIHEYNDYEYGL